LKKFIGYRGEQCDLGVLQDQKGEEGNSIGKGTIMPRREEEAEANGNFREKEGNLGVGERAETRCEKNGIAPKGETASENRSG